jgi:hypothetical protein
VARKRVNNGCGFANMSVISSIKNNKPKNCYRRQFSLALCVPRVSLAFRLSCASEWVLSRRQSSYDCLFSGDAHACEVSPPLQG